MSKIKFYEDSAKTNQVYPELDPEEMAQKANIDGYYEEMTVGAADNLTGRGDGAPASFLYRTAGGDEDIADGLATITNIKGNTLVFNQLIDHGNFDSNANFHCESGAVVQTVSDNTLPVKITDVSSGHYPVLVCSKPAATFKQCQGHKVLLRFDYKGSHNSDAVPATSMYLIYNKSPWSSYQLMNPVKRDLPTLKTYWQRYGYIFTMKEYSDDPSFVNVYITTQLAKKSNQSTASDIVADDMWYFKNYMFIDLTAMFGAGNEPETVEEFEALFPLSYYNYNKGSILNFTGESLKTNGFNQWDEEWEIGRFNTTTGENYDGAPRQIRAKNLIKVFPNTNYYFQIPSTINIGEGAWVMFFDGEMNPISGYEPNIYHPKASNCFLCNSYYPLIKTPSNARYMRFYMTEQYGKVYNNDICINLSWSGYRNGEYEEYWEQTRSLSVSDYFPTGMKSTYTVNDELTSTKAIQRTYELNLSNRTWNYARSYSYISLGNITPAIPAIKHNGASLKNTGLPDKITDVRADATYNTIMVTYAADAFANAAEVKAAIDAANTIVVYEIETPVETDIETPINMSYKVSDFGTEQILPVNTITPVTSPFKGTILYGMNAVDTLRRLPVNYVSKESMNNFLGELGESTQSTWSAEYNEETGQYDYNTDLDLSQKANIDGYYEEMTVGAADNLTGKGDGVPAIFTRRTAGGDEDIAGGVATINSIKGDTIVWNQLIKNGNFASWSNWNYTANSLSVTTSNNIAEFTVHTVPATAKQVVRITQSVPKRNNGYVSGHKIYITYNYKGNITGNTPLYTWCQYLESQSTSPWNEHSLTPTLFNNAAISANWQRYHNVVTCNAYTTENQDTYVNLLFTLNFGLDNGWNYDQLTVGDKFYFKNIMIIDLTRMFGAGNEPSTPEEFETLFPLDYYDYNTGSLLNFTGESLKTVGFNQWDEQWENGTFNTTTGENLDGSSEKNQIRTKNNIKVFPNTRYRFTMPVQPRGGHTGYVAAWIMFYDNSGNIITGYNSGNNTAGNCHCCSNTTPTIVTPPNAASMKFYMTIQYGNTYTNDICVNLSWSGYRDGEYEEYWERTKDLPVSTYAPNGMNSANTVCDELTSTKYIQRTKRLILNGTEDWNNFVLESSGLGRAILVVSDILNTQYKSDFICDKLPVVNFSPAWTLPYNCISPGTNGSHQVLIYLQNASSLDDIKAQLAANPIEICYKLAEPIETDLEETLNLNYKVSDFGTEEILPANTSTPTTSPFNGQIVYGINATDTIRRLPESYISEDSMESFLSALNTATNGTWAMTYNSETGKYGFTFTPNQE